MLAGISFSIARSARGFPRWDLFGFAVRLHGPAPRVGGEERAYE